MKTIMLQLEAEEVSSRLYLREKLGDFEMGDVKGVLSAVVPSGSLHVQITEPVKACYLVSSHAVVEAVIKAVQS